MVWDRKSDMVKSAEKHLDGVHSAAAVGFGRAADAYERGRPEYPIEATQFVSKLFSDFCRRQADGSESLLEVCDLAAGTGKFTKVLAGFESIGFICAVEPVAEMRAKCSEFFSRTKSKIPAIVMEGTAESIPLSNESVDVVTVAQAFHWFDGDKALPEIFRVLKPGGIVMLIWNVRDESHAWIREMTNLMVPFEGSAPRYRSLNWKIAFDQTTLFTPLELSTFSNLTTGTIDTMLDRVASVSFVAALPEEDRSELLSRMRKLYQSQMQEQPSGLIEMPYETHIYIARKT